MRPTFFRSPAPDMPLTTTQKTIRAISILISLMKPSPRGLSWVDSSGRAMPHITPSTRPIMTCRKIERVQSFQSIAGGLQSVRLPASVDIGGRTTA
ncbi:hypothetical protein D3C84_953530 [compost metagenome]